MDMLLTKANEVETDIGVTTTMIIDSKIWDIIPILASVERALAFRSDS